LNNVSIDLRKGEIIAIVGENGAGKSTLMKILAGDYSHGTYNGEISIGGKHVQLFTPRHAEKVGIAMIYQHIHVELDLTVAENICLGMLPRNAIGLVDWNRTKAIAREALNRLKLDINPATIMSNLNTSMQQLVCIARALVRNPKVLLLDEPTSALTESETRNLLDILKELKRTGISCIYISHKLKEVFEIFDRIFVLRDALNISCYTKDELDSRRIIEDMIGRRIDAMYPSMEGREIGEEVLRVEHLKVSHPVSPNKNIIEDVSFSLRRGEVIGLAGLVGSGRSELLRAIFGALPKRGGKVYLDGRECDIRSTRAAIHHHVGFLTEDRKNDGVIGTMNIKENMTLSILRQIAAGPFISKQKEEKKAAWYFDLLKIKAPSINTDITSLSGGNQQKVVLAKSLLTDMKVLFLDEPTVGIDVGTKAEIYKIIKNLAEGGLSIVMVSSEYPELIAMCDRFIVIANGHVVGEVQKSEVSEATLIRLASSV